MHLEIMVTVRSWRRLVNIRHQLAGRNSSNSPSKAEQRKANPAEYKD
jgi:hypothetical protein